MKVKKNERRCLGTHEGLASCSKRKILNYVLWQNTSILNGR
jgi:hypothetical protein